MSETVELLTSINRMLIGISVNVCLIACTLVSIYFKVKENGRK